MYYNLTIGLTILLHDLDAHQLPSIKSKIISMGGVAVNTRSFRGQINYVVVPIVFNEKSLSIKATIVSCLWIVSTLLSHTYAKIVLLSEHYILNMVIWMCSCADTIE